MSKSDENEDQSSKEAVLVSNQDSPENVVVADGSAGHGATKDCDEVEDSLKSKDVAVVNEANTSSSTSRDTGISKHEKEEEKQRVLLQKVSEELHCPFYWQADIPINAYKSHEIDLLPDSEEMFDQTTFQYRRFVIHLVMCYHKFSKGSLPESIQLLENMERMLVRSARRDNDDFLFNTIRTALYHISHGCRVYIHIQTNQIEKAYKTMEKITSYEFMDDANKAGIWGIRAAVYAEYGYEGVKTAVTFMEKALELDKKNPFWYFYRGVYLGRLRRMQKGPRGPKVPTDEEIQSLQTALGLRKDPAFLAFIAETFTELIKSIRVKDYPEPYQEHLTRLLEKMSTTAADYFEESVAKKENSAHLLFRCGKGLMRLPPPYQNLVKAKQYLEKGLEISPKSPFGNHAMAMFKAECENDSEEAERYLELSKDRKNFQAHLDFCRLRYLKDQSGEFLIAELKTMLEENEEIPKRCRLYAELICCYLFVKRDLVEACKCAKSLLEIQTEWMEYIYGFKSSLFPFSQAVALVDILVAETRLRSLHKNVPETERNEHKIFFNFLLQRKVPLHDISKNIFQKYEEDLKRGLSKKRAQMTAKPSRHQEAESRPKEDVRHKRNDHRDKSRSPSRERRRPNERRREDKHTAYEKRPSGTRADRGAVDKAKHTLHPPTEEISTNEKIEAFIANSQQKGGGEIRYSVEEASKNVANMSVRDKEDRTDDRKSVKSSGDAKGRRSVSSSPDRQSKSGRRKEDKRNRHHSSSSEEKQSRSSRKSHREGKRTDRESRSEHAPKKSNGRRSPSPDHKSVTSSRSHRKDERRHSSSSPDDRRADTQSIRSSRSNRKDLESASRSGRGTRAERSPRSVASSRRNQRKERDDRSRSSSSSSSSRSRSRGSKRRSKRSISRESRRSRRSHRRRSHSSDRSKRSSVRKDGERYSRRRKNRDLSTSESSSSSSSSDRRSRKSDRRRRHRSRSSSSSSGDRSRQSRRSRGSRAHRSPDQRRRRRRLSDRSESESSSSGSTVHTRASKHSEVKK